MSPTVLIIGGGVAGTAAALALQKAGIPAEIHEADPEPDAVGGAFLTLASNGMRALRQIDAGEAVAAAGGELRSMLVTDGGGAQLADIPIGDHTDPATCFRYLTRAELVAALRRAAEARGIVVRTGRRLVAVSRHDDALTATFADGTTARGGLLIGADGLNSTVRSLIDPSARAPRYVGQRVFYGASRGRHALDTSRFHVVRGATAFGYIAADRGETWWFARVDDAELSRAAIAGGTTAAWQAYLLHRLGAEEVPSRIVAAATRVQVTNAYDLPDVARWHRNGMVIIGDAAHAASPATGQGASMALEDAVILAKTLRDLHDAGAALATYEQLRRARVDANIAASARLSSGGRPGGPSARPAGPSIDEQIDWNRPTTALAPAT
ncbi:FAD-dependent monooxygenase [Pseudonocardia sp. GCM10023141]|uniref:FAD-dependent monooxygenase n=1 Tax=Pseudonocardia sp. GCM10023141 TaxID=3252653 RepID=UPI00361C5D27